MCSHDELLHILKVTPPILGISYLINIFNNKIPIKEDKVTMFLLEIYIYIFPEGTHVVRLVKRNSGIYCPFRCKFMVS